jgi:hypothetical protein
VYLPLGRLENDGSGDLITSLWESCKYIPDDIWLEYVLPQMAYERTWGFSEYVTWTKDSSVYATEGTVWRGESFDEESIERIPGSRHAIVPRQ